MTWSFRLTNLNQVPIGEILNASERKLKIGIKQVDTASFKIRADNELLLPLFAEDTLLQAWQGDDLRFFGPVITPEFASDDSGGEATVAVNAVSPMWRLNKRLGGTSAAGFTYTNTDRGAIAKNEIDATNLLYGDTGIETESASVSGSISTYTAGPYKPIITEIRELANAFDGFDWRCSPLTGNATKIGRFEVAPIIGSERPDAVFEYGCGLHNIRSMTFKRDLSNMMNDAYHITDNGAADPAGVIEFLNTTSSDIRGRYQGVVESAGIFDPILRFNWAAENAIVRGTPRLIATMTSDLVEDNGRVPVPFTDYEPGDFVPARARSHNVQLFDGLVRCYAIEISVDENGTATYIPTLVEEAGSGAEEA